MGRWDILETFHHLWPACNATIIGQLRRCERCKVGAREDEFFEAWAPCTLEGFRIPKMYRAVYVSTFCTEQGTHTEILVRNTAKGVDDFIMLISTLTHILVGRNIAHMQKPCGIVACDRCTSYDQAWQTWRKRRLLFLCGEHHAQVRM